MFKHIPDFAVGRMGYDNWLIWYARRKLIPVVDLSKQLKVIHQNLSLPFLFTMKKEFS